MPRVAVAGEDRVSIAPSSRFSGIQNPRTVSRYQHWQRIRSRICTNFSKALTIQLIVVRNATGSIACAWLTNVCYSFGNIFSGKSSHLQSRDELIVANSVWAGIAFCTVVFASYTPFMLSLRFLNAPDQPPSLWFCFIRLARATIIYFVAAIIAVFGFGYLVAYLAQLEPATYNFKIESYADNLSLLVYFTGITREMNRIYYEETCQGRDKLQNKRKRSRNCISNGTRVVTPQSEPSAPTRHHTPVFWKAMVKQLPSSAPPILATAFVHVLSRQRIVERGPTTLGLFFFGGITVKLGIQELSKLYIVKKRIRSIRIMCVLVGVPSVLIDTQTRIILTGSSNIQTAVKGVITMALIEILFRVVKVKLLQWTITKREQIILRENRDLSVVGVMRPRPSLSSMHVEFEIWRRQVQAFHTVELNADMYAEYIAIGCSGSILFFFGMHPHYPLLRQSYSAEEIIDLSTWRQNQLYVLGFQFGVEVVVDYISIALEMATGLEFDQIKSLRSFLAVLFMVTAVMNITISIGIYLG